MKINDDEFDYIFYTYGLKLYEKMPLIEPLEDRVTYTRNTDQAFSYMRRYGLGYTQTDEVICALINRHRCYYSDNVTGERVTNYIKDR